MKVTSPAVITGLLAENGLNPLKKFGQNFLTDQNIVEKIADAAAPKNSYALEIGMGLGALTDALCRRAAKVVTIEIDKGLTLLAQKTQSEHKNLIVAEGDVLNADFAALAEKYFENKPFYICGNLPYYITASIIMKALENPSPAVSLTAMVQKEVAQRLAAKPKDADYGIITALVDYFGGAEILFKVSKNCFYPAPKVDSAVVKININRDKKVPFEAYRSVVKAAFAMRRKTVLNNLKAAYGQKAGLILAECNIDPSLRAQDLSPRDYLNIAERAQKYSQRTI